MSTVERILAELTHRDAAAVTQVHVGRKYTAVALADGNVGVALTQLPEGLGCCDGAHLSPADRQNVDELLRRVEEQVGGAHVAGDLLANLRSSRPELAATGLACVNALANRADVEGTDGDILDRVDLRPSDTIGMVGHFRPLVPRLRHMTSTLHIFERHGGKGLLPAEQAAHLLPSCDVALITAGTIANGTLDDLLVAAASCREVALLGASVPLLPRAFHDSPVTWLSGSVVTEGAETLRVIAEGGGRREFNRLVHKVNLSCR